MALAGGCFLRADSGEDLIRSLLDVFEAAPTPVKR
jgi:hypothetical protein